MAPYTYTLVVKVGTNTSWWTEDKIVRVVKEVMGDLPCNPVVARVSHGEALVRVHVLEDSSAYGIKLANWLGQMPFHPPFPQGSLLWYV